MDALIDIFGKAPLHVRLAASRELARQIAEAEYLATFEEDPDEGADLACLLLDIRDLLLA